MKTERDGKPRYTLTFDELLRFVHQHDRFFRRRYPGHSRERRVLGRTVKLSEEVGELASAVLSSLGAQRTAKLLKHRDDHVGEEMADVIITTLVIAEVFGIDVREPLSKKIAKIKERVKNW